MDLVQQGPARVSNPLYLQSPGQPSPLYQVEDDVDEVSLQAVTGLCVGVVHGPPGRAGAANCWPAPSSTCIRLEPACVGGLLQDPETKMGWLL